MCCCKIVFFVKVGTPTVGKVGTAYFSVSNRILCYYFIVIILLVIFKHYHCDTLTFMWFLESVSQPAPLIFNSSISVSHSFFFKEKSFLSLISLNSYKIGRLLSFFFVVFMRFLIVSQLTPQNKKIEKIRLLGKCIQLRILKSHEKIWTIKVVANKIIYPTTYNCWHFSNRLKSLAVPTYPTIPYLIWHFMKFQV